MQTAIEKLNDIKKQYPHWTFKEEPKSTHDRIIGYCKKHQRNFSLFIHNFPKKSGCPECNGIKNICREKFDKIKEQHPHWIFEEEPKTVTDRITGHCKEHDCDFTLCIHSFPTMGGCPHCMKRKIISISFKKQFDKIKEQHPHWIFKEEPKTVTDRITGHCKEHDCDFTLCIHEFPKGTGCPECVGRKRNIPVNESFTKIKEQYPHWIFKEEPKTVNDRITGHCKEHDCDFTLHVMSFPKGTGCSECMGRKRNIPVKESFDKIKEQYPHWILNDEPKLSKDRIIGHCKEHDCDFTLCVSLFPKIGGCPECMGRKRHIPVKESFDKIKEQYPHWILNDEPKSVMDKINCHCEKHDYNFNLILAYFPKTGGCPFCMKRDFVGHFAKFYALYLIEKIDLLKMDEQDLFEIISMKGFPTKFNVLLNSSAGSKERENSINELKKSIENESEEEFEKENEQEEQSKEENNSVSGESTSEITVSGQEDEDAIASLDSILSSISGMDKANIFIGEGEKFLVTRNINRIWNLALKADEDDSLEDFVNDFKSRTSSGQWFDYIRDGFFNEYNTAVSIKKDSDCVFLHEPNLMQKLMVFKGMTHANYGNWCGTGTGKSFARDLLSRAIDARVSVYIVPNSTVKQTVEELTKKHYNNPIECVLVPSNPSDICSMDTSKHNYIVLNYDKFNQYNTSEWIDAIVSKNPKIDFVCLDEVQNVKVRDDKNASSRYQNVLAFVTKIREMNSNVKVLAMSATPIVINLTEVVMLLNLLTGYDYSNEIGKQMTYTNVHNAYKALVLNGFRYLKTYKEIKQNPIEFVEIGGSELFDELSKVNVKQGVLPIEKILLPKKLEAIKDRMCEGTILYVEYIDHGKFIPMIRDFLDKQGITSVTYIGNDDKDTRNDNLKKFKEGKVQTMILSSTGSTGLDGLQKKGHQIIPLSLPWTSAEMEQLKGRIVRTGYEAGKDINIVVPQVIVTMPNGKVWSWDKRRWSKIKNRQTRGEMVMDGNFKSVKEYDEKKVKSILLNNAIKALQEGLIDKNVAREPITSDKVAVVEHTRENVISLINDTHRKANTSRHENIAKNVFENSQDKFKEYHRIRREAIENKWTADPLDKVAEIINSYKPKRYENIIDLGCGENLLKKKVIDGENRVTGVDVEQIDETVIKADCANLKGIIEDESKQMAVHCLSLWGTLDSCIDYFKEDYRILESGMDAPLIIVEPSDKFGENSHFGTIDDFVAKVEEVGFRKNGNVETENGFCFFRFTK